MRTVTERRDGAFVVHVAEEDEFSVDELVEAHQFGVFAVQVHIRQFKLGATLALLHEVGQPVLALLNHLLTERLQAQFKSRFEQRMLFCK